MLFNSYEFLFAFLPLTVAAYAVVRGRFGLPAAFVVLTVCSAFFYGWWRPDYLLLVFASSLGNFLFGQWIARTPERGRWGGRNWVTGLGIAANLGLLGYFKYAGLAVESVNALAGTAWRLDAVDLPLGISFFTFTQIAYLIDVRQGKVHSGRPLPYLLFVVFFPHLIAGPIIHYKELVPQFSATLRARWQMIAVGAFVFATGLFKKTVVADALAGYASPVFNTAAQGRVPTFLEAWAGALAYALQLYFDFSAYSDMAVGLAAVFGICFPINFNSPYQAGSIIEFWRRWHVTLSRFLRDYLYFPLGGSRKGPVRRHLNLMTTMLLGGLWHGANWKFLLWGGAHGGLLVLNHGWRHLRAKLSPQPAGRVERLCGWALTFVAVVVAWVPFRAANMDTTGRMVAAMAGANGVVLPNALGGLTRRFPDLFPAGMALDPALANWPKGVVVIGLAAGVAWLAPNVYQLLGSAAPLLDDDGRRGLAPLARPWPLWNTGRRWAVATAALTALGILGMSHVSEFLYFKF